MLTKGLPVLAVLMLAVGAFLGLSWAPPDRDMGEVSRIMYVHVPAVWMALLAFTLNFGASLYYLFRSSPKADSLAEAAASVGLLFGAVGVTLGAIWGRPTWGTYWTWDPRLTTAAIMLVVYAGYMALRRFVDDPDRRATWAAAVGILAFVDIPILWFSVRWWKGLHQVQSSPSTMDGPMVLALRWNAVAFLVLFITFLVFRYRMSLHERTQEEVLPT